MKKLVLSLFTLSLLATPQVRPQSEIMAKVIEKAGSINLRQGLFAAANACAKPIIMAKSLIGAYPLTSLSLGVITAIIAAKITDPAAIPGFSNLKNTLKRAQELNSSFDTLAPADQWNALKNLINGLDEGIMQKASPEVQNNYARLKEALNSPELYESFCANPEGFKQNLEIDLHHIFGVFKDTLTQEMAKVTTSGTYQIADMAYFAGLALALYATYTLL